MSVEKDHPASFSFRRLWPTIKRLLGAILRRPMPRKSKGQFWPQAIAALVIVSVTVALVFTYLDETVVRYAQALTDEHPVIHGFFAYFTNAGKTLWVMLLGVPFAVYWACNYWPVGGFETIRRRFGIYADANYLLFSVGFAGGFASLIKNIIGRARPQFLDTLGPYHFEIARFHPDFAAFPSGHSATFGALMISLALVMPTYRWWFLALGLLGGISRTMLGAHFPSDVLAGLAFGAAIALYFAHYMRRRGLLFADDGALWPNRHR